tara:strand:- start:1233 stop:2327 length:1095 start_codon:yes stop_codon:yes gene_type:complete
MEWLGRFFGSKDLKKEERELRWILQEYLRFKLIHKYLLHVKDKGSWSTDYLKKAHLLFTREERTERKLAQAFERMEDELGDDLKRLEDEHSQKFNFVPKKVDQLHQLLKEAEIFNSDLIKEGSSGGELEQLFEQSKRSFRMLNDLIKRVERILKRLKGFEAVVEKIEGQTIVVDRILVEVLREKSSRNYAKGRLDQIREIEANTIELFESFQDDVKQMVGKLSAKQRELETEIQDVKEKIRRGESPPKDSYLHRHGYTYQDQLRELEEDFDVIPSYLKRLEEILNYQIPRRLYRDLKHQQDFFSNQLLECSSLCEGLARLKLSLDITDLAEDMGSKINKLITDSNNARKILGELYPEDYKKEGF